MDQGNRSTKQVADEIGVHKNTILNWIKTGKTQDTKRDWRGHRIWTDKDIGNLLKLKNRIRQLELGPWLEE